MTWLGVFAAWVFGSTIIALVVGKFMSIGTAADEAVELGLPVSLPHLLHHDASNRDPEGHGAVSQRGPVTLHIRSSNDA